MFNWFTVIPLHSYIYIPNIVKKNKIILYTET